MILHACSCWHMILCADDLCCLLLVDCTWWLLDCQWWLILVDTSRSAKGSWILNEWCPNVTTSWKGTWIHSHMPHLCLKLARHSGNTNNDPYVRCDVSTNNCNNGFCGWWWCFFMMCHFKQISISAIADCTSKQLCTPPPQTSGFPEMSITLDRQHAENFTPKPLVLDGHLPPGSS